MHISYIIEIVSSVLATRYHRHGVLYRVRNHRHNSQKAFEVSVTI